MLRGVLSTIGPLAVAASFERTALILVGRVLGGREFRESALYDPEYRRRFRGGASDQ